MHDLIGIGLQLIAIALNGAILFRQGGQEQKTIDHDRRITNLERKYKC